MTLITGDARMRVMAARLVAILAAVVAVGGCSAAAVPAATTSGALPTASPVAASAVAAAAAARSLAPSATAAIVKITPIPGASDSKVVVHLVVGPIHRIGTTLTAWDRIAISAPVGKVWHVSIDNLEKTIPHNFVVASGPTFPERIFETPKYPAGTHAFDIPALPAGRYLFICTLHPNVMTGTLTIE